MLLMIVMEKNLLEPFTKKNCKKQIKNSLELKNLSREKTKNYKLNCLFNSWIDKKDIA